MKPKKHLHKHRDIDSLANLKDTPYNRDLVAKYAKIQAILVSGTGEPSARRQASRVEKALWLMIEAQIAGKDEIHI